MKKISIVALLFLALVSVSVTVAAENAPTEKQAVSACGDSHATFKVTRNPKDHPLAPAVTGKAQVYIIEEFEKPWNEIGNPTIRVGMDGSWIGANQGGSYLFSQVDPGEHHLCVNWQSKLKQLNKLIALTDFKAKPGQAYYFRSRFLMTYVLNDGPFYTLDLEPINSDEAMLLLARYPHSVSTLEK